MIGKGRKKVIFVSVLILALFLTTACQPTPDKPVVVNKNDGKIEQKIEQTEAPAKKYEAPKIWKQEYNIQDGKYIINVDAAINMPDVDKYPVVRIVPGEITQEIADKALKNLFGNTPVYEIVEEQTKSELTEQLLQQKATLAKLKKEAKPGQTEVELVEGTSSQMVNINDFEQQIKDLEEQIKTAPDKIEKKLLDSNFKNGKDGAKRIGGQADMGQKVPAYFQVNYGGSRNPYYSIDFYNDENSIGPYLGKADNPPETLTFTKEDAVKKAQDFMDTVGIKNMKVAQIDMVSRWEGDAPTDGKVTGYCINYTLEIKGIQELYNFSEGEKWPEKQSKGETPTKEEREAMMKSYRPTMPQEMMHITVMPNEIREFMWQGIVQEGETLNENVELLPFDQVMARFEEMMKVKYASQDTYQKPEKDIVKVSTTESINDIEFGYARLSVKDQIDQYMYMPVWCFYGDFESNTVTYKNGKTKTYNAENQEFASRNKNCLLTLNAIDGSIIERN